MAGAEITIVPKDGACRPGLGPTGLLFECAPDSPLRRSGTRVVPVEELAGPFGATKAAAHAISARLLAHEPEMDGVRQLAVLEEVVIRELTRILHVLHLDGWLCARGIARCVVSGRSQWSDEMHRARAHTGSTYAIDVVPGGRPGTAAAGLWRALTAESSPGVLVRAALRRAFPFGVRLAGARSKGRRDVTPGGWWVYSTAYTYTRIALAYEPFMPAPPRYLIENPSTGGRALAERSRPAFDLYAFAALPDRPSHAEAAAAAARIRAHLEAVPLDGPAAIARTLLLEGGWFRQFCERLLPLGLFQTRVLRRWLNVAQPEVIVVGNAAFEGYLLQQARRRGVPAILLQHGVLGDYYELMNQPVDRIVVRGPAFKEFLSPEARKKAVVLDVPDAADPVAVGCGRDILFLTAPYSMQPFFHEDELDDILGALGRAAGRARRTLIVRVHPLESVAAYRKRVWRLYRRERIAGAFECSQGGGLEPLLCRAAVAVTFSSTVFLDCLRARVPVISFGWHDFSLRPQVEAHGAFQFASNLAHLETLVTEALAGRLRGRAEALPAFRAPTQPAKLTAFFAGIATP